jgi:MSHA biogenesis protein MshE
MTSILTECGLITAEQVEEAVSRQIETGRMIGETLVELGITTEESIIWALSKQLGIPFADVRPESVDAELVRRFPESLLRRTQSVPLFRSPEGVTIACADPSDGDAIASLQEAAESAVTFVIGGPDSIRRALDTVLGVAKSPDAEARTAIVVSDDAAPASDIVWDRGGRNFLLFHLHAAREQEASEIHFVPSGSSLAVSYRTDRGLAFQSAELPETGLYLRTRLQSLGVPDLDRGDLHTVRGHFLAELDGGRVACHAFHARTHGGIATVIRLGPVHDQAPDLSALGLSPIGEAEIREFVDGPEGLVIVTGPPRSGGSMVLASLTALAARPERRILVVDDGSVAPYPRDAVRVRGVIGTSGREQWQPLALGLGADVVVLDDVLNAEAIADVLCGATVGRLVFARTDWLAPKALLRFLASRPAGRVVLRDRPLALVTLPHGRLEGSAVWTAPDDADARAGSLDVTLLTDDDRDALARGGRNQ